ncbi:MAG: hypothetical protein QOE70_183 [Chthoniobacter sp.]|jgi:hypothetical protein|nr:hypothetical protein [Chthoniobacter sp.]
MTWFRKPLAILSALVIGASLLAAKKDDKPKSPEKAEKKKDKDKTKGKDKDSKGDKPAPSATTDPKAPPAEPENNSRIAVPLAPGHDAKKLVIPVRNVEGKIQMRFAMEIGKRADLDHLEMTTLVIETFDENEKSEMVIDLPQSTLDLNTRVISTQTGVLIKRSDFELTGKVMDFNTETRAGKIAGNVRMLIYNLEE